MPGTANAPCASSPTPAADRARAMHREHRSWIETQLAHPFDGETILVTHHAPHANVLSDHAQDVPAAYASDLEALIKQYKPSRWFFGHCHDAKNVTVGGTRLINVSLGYSDEVTDSAGRLEELVVEM